MKIIVKMTWSEGKNQWHMELPDGTFIQEFYYCANISKLFKDLDKDKPKLYSVEVLEWKGAVTNGNK